MKNEIYRSVVRGSKDSPDGESPSVVSVTEEANGFFVWIEDYEILPTIQGAFVYRDPAIEFAVSLARQLRSTPRGKWSIGGLIELSYATVVLA